MIDVESLKLCSGILGQAIIDAYLGRGMVKASAVRWFKDSGYRMLASVLRSGWRFRDLFTLSGCNWEDIPGLIERDPCRVYMSYKVVPFLEGLSSNPNQIVIVQAGKIKKESRLGLRKKYRAVQLVHKMLVGF